MLRLLFRGMIADLLMYEFLELMEAELEAEGGWYRLSEVNECLFWSTLLKLGVESYIEYRDVTDGGAIIFSADWADIKDNKLPVEDCLSSISISFPFRGLSLKD